METGGIWIQADPGMERRLQREWLSQANNMTVQWMEFDAHSFDKCSACLLRTNATTAYQLYSSTFTTTAWSVPALRWELCTMTMFLRILGSPVRGQARGRFSTRPIPALWAREHGVVERRGNGYDNGIMDEELCRSCCLE